MRALAIVCWLAAIAQADVPRIVVVETRDAPPLPALGPQLEAHTSGRATVVVRTERDADPLTFAGRATAMVAAREATLVVWLAHVDRGYLVFASGSWPGRALIELVRIDDTLEPAELERTIALKVAGLLDVLLAPAPANAPVERVALGLARPAPVPAATRWRIEIAGVLAREPHERGSDPRAALGLGRVWRRGGWTIAPALAAHWQPSGAIDGTSGRATITELGAAVTVEVGRGFGPLDGFARPRFVASALSARGTSSDGRTGRATLFSPYTGIELGLRRAASPHVAVGLVAGVEVAAIRRELTIDDMLVIDLGRTRLHVGLALTVGL